VAFPRKLLNQQEDVVLDLHPHWWDFTPQLAALIASVVVGLFVLISDLPGILNVVVGVVVLACLGWFGLAYVTWLSTNFVVTTDRLIYRSGVLTKRGVEIPLERVNTVHFSQTVFERMLGMGDLDIESAGAQGMQHFHNVRKPSLVQNEIHHQMEANENRKFDRISRHTTGHGANPSGPSIPEQIEQLDELRRRGALSEAEFQAKKAQLLDRM
jgi:uncharacterized membrane protein YdbT with pleckstrin-like domain